MTEAKAIIEKYEWLGTMPGFVIRCYGIFFDGVCGGVVVYSNEYAENLGVWDKFGYTGKIICLSRGACLHWAHPHAASKLIRGSMRLLPERYKVVTATVDAQAGEIGIIYQACSFDYIGVMSHRYGDKASIMLPDGKRMSGREAGINFGTQSIPRLRSMGFNVASVPRKRRYFAFVGSKTEKRQHRKQIEHLLKPYPKTVEPVQPQLQSSKVERTILSMTNLSEVLSNLQAALSEAEKAEKQLEDAKAKLKPLMDMADSKRNAVHVLMNQYQSATMADAPPFGKRGSRKATGERRTYNIDPAKAVETQFKRSFTKAKAAGSSDSEALKIANDTAAGTAQSKGVPFTPHKKPPTK